MSSPHILVLPLPAQGHVIPMMELSQSLVNHGFKVTFVNTDFNHNCVTNALPDDQSHIRRDCIDLVSIPDGLEPGQDTNDPGKLSETMQQVMPGNLEELMEKINNRGEGDKITCVIADQAIGWALEIVVKMKIKTATFWPASAAVLALKLSIPKLIYEGIIDNDGPLLASRRLGNSAGYFWPQDSTCLECWIYSDVNQP
ncbi:hypothetical protein PS1_045655 [Malus domestica]